MTNQKPLKSFTITLLDTGKTFNCDNESNLVTMHNKAGAGSIRNRCHGGGCGLCRVQVVSGQYHSTAMSRSYISVEEQSQGIVLACCTTPRSDLELRPLQDRPTFSLGLQPQAKGSELT